MLAGLSKSICFGIAGSITTGVAATKLLSTSSLPGGVKHFSVMVSNNQIWGSIIVSKLKTHFMFALSCSFLNSPSFLQAEGGNPKKANSIYEFTAKDIDGNDVSLAKYQGHVCVIVNVASK